MKGKMILNYSLLAVLCLGSVGLTSCKRRKEPTLQAFQNINLHIAQFSISKEVKVKNDKGEEVSRLDPTISSTFFSIDNHEGEGIIVNRKPLPYGTELNDIKLSIIPVLEGITTEISLDGGKEFKDWKKEEKKTFNLPKSSDDVRIRLGYKSNATAQKYTYTYRVQVNVHKFDPATIHWGKLSTPATDVLANKVAFETYTLGGGKMMLMTADKGSKTNKFYELNTGNNTFEEVTYPALPNGAFIKHIENYKDKVFALASDNKLYELTSKQSWTALNQEAEVLLGVFAPRKEATEPSLSLIIKEGGKAYFAHYENANSKLIKGEEVMMNFPKANYQTLSTYKSEVGAALTLLADDALLYQTTNATAWALPNGEDKVAVQANDSFAFAQNGDLFYRFTASAEGLAIYTKTALQSVWEKNSEVALMPKDGQSFDAKAFANSPIAIWVKGKDFYLYKGGAQPQLYKGELKKDAI